MAFKSIALRAASALFMTQTALAGCAGSSTTESASVEADRQSHQPQEAVYSEQQKNHVALLDKLLSEHNYAELANSTRNSADSSLIVSELDWGKTRMMAGKSVIVPLLYSTELWVVGSANPQYANLQETAALITIYSLMVIYADGVKCADQTAPGHRIDAVATQYREPLKMLATLPVAQRTTIIEAAARMEAYTAPLRTNDNYLCRFGMQETIDNLKKGQNLKELQPQPGQVGKQLLIQDDLDYEPEYVSRDQWEPEQRESRSRLLPAFAALLDKMNGALSAPTQQIQ
jgi:hypothetical protein